MIKAVLFDLDGVLVDTEGVYTEFWTQIEREYPTGVDNFANVIKGSTLPSIYSRYFPCSDIQTDISRRLKDFELNMPLKLFDGVDDCLKALRSACIKTAIVTSSNLKKMRRVMGELALLREFTDILITDEDVEYSKPHPQGYLLAAKRLGALPDNFVVVEDSLAGLEAGRRAGGKVIGVATTNSREIISPKADVVLNRASEITVDLLMTL